MDNLTLGTLQKTEDAVLCIEWTLTDFRDVLSQNRRGSTVVIATSPAFQMKDITWSLELSLTMCGTDEEGFYVCVRRQQSEIASHWVNCQIVVKVGERIIGGSVEKKYVGENEDVCSFIAEKREFLSYVHREAVRVLCTFYREVEGRTFEEISQDVSERGKHTSMSVIEREGIDILSSHMKNVFLNRENCDFVIKVKNKEFQVHKAIVGARSPVLAAMLQHDMKEKNSNATEIVDCEPDIFEQFLHYLYTGRLEELSSENVTSLHTLGDKYDLEHLRKECVAFMECNMSVDAFCDAILLAVQHNLSSLLERAEKFFLENVTEILVTPKWQLLMKEHPTTCNELYIKHANSLKEDWKKNRFF